MQGANIILKGYENKIIRHYLNKYDDNVLEVAKRLDVSKSKIYQLLKEGNV